MTDLANMCDIYFLWQESSDSQAGPVFTKKNTKESDTE